MKVTPLSLLLATTFLSTSAMAQTVPTIDANYLNGKISLDMIADQFHYSKFYIAKKFHYAYGVYIKARSFNSL